LQEDEQPDAPENSESTEETTNWLQLLL
jgi:hypothetical protein